MSDDESISRQCAKDREYIRACREHGIKPDPARYVTGSTDPEDIDYYARLEATTTDIEPLKPLTPEAEAAGRVIDLLMPRKIGAREFVQTAGRRALAMAWLLGKRPEPLAELARQLGISRASLSTHVRRLEDATGVHARGQKLASSRSIYADNARKSWKLRRLNKAMADAVAE